MLLSTQQFGICAYKCSLSMRSFTSYKRSLAFRHKESTPTARSAFADYSKLSYLIAFMRVAMLSA